jgi:hypothetical protein
MLLQKDLHVISIEHTEKWQARRFDYLPQLFFNIFPNHFAPLQPLESAPLYPFVILSETISQLVRHSTHQTLYPGSILGGNGA